MIKCKVIKEFTLKEFEKLQNLKRMSNLNKQGRLYVDDTFECSKQMAEYLMGNNPTSKKVIKILEYIPESSKK